MDIWTPCDRSLPDKTGDYLVTRTDYMSPDETSIDIEFYSTVYGWCCGEIEILAWMPLPEPYKGE